MLRRCAGGKAAEDNPAYRATEVRMALDEWIAWALPKYEEFAVSHPELTPCAARVGDTGHYEIGNIRIVSTKQNRKEMRTILLLRDDGMKLCADCRQDKKVSDFGRNRSRPDGLQTICRQCVAIRNKAYGHRDRKKRAGNPRGIGS
jgi:hypothetical protein